MSNTHPTTSYKLAPVYSGAGSVLFLIIWAILTPPHTYLRGLLFDRGPSAFVIVFLGINILTTTILALIRNDHRNSLIIALFARILMMLALGVVGAAMGIGSIVSGVGKALLDSSTPDWPDIVGEIAIGLGVSSDPIFLALCFTVITMPLLITLSAGKGGDA